MAGWRWVGLALLTTAAGCSPATAPGLQGQAPVPAAPPGPRAAPAATASPQHGGALEWAGYTNNATTHPYKGSSVTARGTIGPAYETLLSYRFEPGYDFTGDFEVIPMLAERWQQRDPATWVFSLQRGVLWHDGEELKADDVAFSYLYARDPKNGFAVVSGRLKDTDRIEALDRSTVLITTKHPIPLFPLELADMNLYILPKHVADRGGSFDTDAVGTGPFKVQSHDPNSATTFVKNERYWRQGRPYVDSLKVIWGTERSAQLASFIAGRNDLLTLPDKAEFEPVRRVRPEIQHVTLPQDSGVSIFAKLDKPPFGDLRVRRAMHLAVDREALKNALTFGDGVPNPPGVPGWKQGWAIPQEELGKLPGYRTPKEQDLAEAKRLLAEAGYPSGFRISIIFNRSAIALVRVPEALTQMWRNIGIDLALEPQETAVFNKRERDGDFEAKASPAIKADLTRLPDYIHSRGPLNKLGLSDPKLDELLDGIFATADTNARKQVVRRLQDHLLEQVYFIPTIDLVAYATWQPWVHDYNPVRGLVVVLFAQDTAGTVWIEREKLPADRR